MWIVIVQDSDVTQRTDYFFSLSFRQLLAQCWYDLLAYVLSDHAML